MNLFEYANKYPNSAGYAKNSETSKMAADQLRTKTFIREYVLSLLMRHGAHGLTPDEAKAIIERETNQSFDRTTIAARFTELKAADRIKLSGARRPTPRGRMAEVHILIDDKNKSI